MKDIYDEMAEKWPSAVVARRELARFSGGLLNPRSVANLDSAGKGPPRKKIGRIVFYPVTGLTRWLRQRELSQIEEC